MSAGADPPRDISLHGDETPTAAAVEPAPRRRIYITGHHIYSLAIVIFISATGTISLVDIAFVVFSTLYLLFLSRISFPAATSDTPPPVFAANNRILGRYVIVGAIVGLILPVVYLIIGILQGDRDGVQAAAPPVFLLATQVLMEGVSFSAGFSLPIRVFVPVFYNSWRLPPIWEWVRIEFAKEEFGRIPLFAGRALAVANLGFWGFNLLGFLLPFYLPKAFKIHYSHTHKD